MNLSGLRRGLALGAPIGIAMGISSYAYTHSISFSLLKAVVLGAVATLIAGAIEGKDARRRDALGIKVANPPVRPKVILELLGDAAQAISLVSQGLRHTDIPIKRFVTESATEVVAITRMSFSYTNTKITAVAVQEAIGCRLEMACAPMWMTVSWDRGICYTYLYMLVKYLRQQLKDQDVRSEVWYDSESKKQFGDAVVMN